MATFKRRVAYLESTGTQWIQVDTTIDQDSSVEVEFSGVNVVANDTQLIFGSSTSIPYFWGGKGSQGNWRIFLSRGSYNNLITETTQAEYNSKSVIGINGSDAYYNDNHYEITSTDSLSYNKIVFFGCASSSGASFLSTVRIYRITLNDHLIIPALDTDNVPCMYDTVSKTCFYNQGTGMFKYEELPSRYPFERLEYLESTGTQWIDTGILPNQDTSAECKFSGQFTNYRLFGARGGPDLQMFECIPYNTTNYGFIFRFGSGTGNNSYVPPSFDTDFIVSLSRSGATVNNVSVAIAQTDDFQCPRSLLLYAGHYEHIGGGDRIGDFAHAKVFYLKLWQDSVLVRNYIPVLWHANVPYIDGNTNTSVTPTTDIPGMYDTVSRKLFINQGTGQFLYGVSNLPTYRTHIPHPMNQLGVNTKDKYFTIDLNITSDNLQFGVTPYWNTGGYCKIVDWGDGNSTDATTSGTALTHTYSTAGKYRVKVIGSMYRFRVGSTNPGAVIDANGNWDALGTLTDGTDMFNNCSNATFLFTDLPGTLVNGFYMFRLCYKARLQFSELPANLTNARHMFNSCRSSTLPFSVLPNSITGCDAFLAGCNIAVTEITNLPASITSTTLWNFSNNDPYITLDLDSIVNNAPLVGWPTVTDVGLFANNAGSANNPGTCTGSIAGFMRKFPNVNSVAGAFPNTNTTTFGINDYFSITLTTIESNFVWGFTPYSSAGTWYCFDWGDNTPITANKNLDVFTNNTRITHTFTTPGTYTIKLAMNADTIEFDAYDSDNGAFDMLGNPVINGTLNTTMNFISYDSVEEQIVIGNEVEQDDESIEVGGGV